MVILKFIPMAQIVKNQGLIFKLKEKSTITRRIKVIFAAEVRDGVVSYTSEAIAWHLKVQPVMEYCILGLFSLHS